KRAPPSPCKVCGSPKHWDRDCEHFGAYLERRKRGVLVAFERPPNEESLYEAVYDAINNAPGSSAYDPSSPARKDDEERSLRASPKWTGPGIIRAPRMEDVDDEDDVKLRASPKWTGSGLLQKVYDPSAPLPLESLALRAEGNDEGFPEGGPFIQAAVFTQALTAAVSISQIAGPPPQDVPLRNPTLPAPERVICMPRKRSYLPGQSAKGISVLSCKARIGAQDEPATDTTMDSGASLTVVHKPFLSTLKHPPKIRKGMKVHIAQLTSNTPDIEGYVTLPVFVRAEDGTMLEFEIEAYVVPHMTVPILLGEDWHLNYELDVLRSVEHGTRVAVGKTGFFFRAFSTIGLGAYNKAARHRRKVALGNGELRAFKDVLVRAHSTALVDFASDLPLDREWFVERNLVCVGRDTFLTVPNALISTAKDPVLVEEDATASRRSAIPVSNPTGTPYLVRAGTVLGYA
ncbi:hypothetical protein AURDEDRAFT_30299, partial [Auricularia subglabra TFB-10046 SS5]